MAQVSHRGRTVFAMSLRRIPFALRALFAVTALIACLAYGISAWGVFGFAREIWRLPLSLCFAAAIAADLLSLAGALASYVLRDANAKVRAYTWSVFFVMTGLSVGAQESFAASRGLPPSARVASGAIVIALAASVHLLIVGKRHAPPSGAPEFAKIVETPAPAEANAKNSQPQAKRTDSDDKPHVPAEPARIAAPATGAAAGAVIEQPPKRTKRPSTATVDHDDISRRVLAKEITYEQARIEGGVKTRRSVELWVAAYRERHPVADVITKRAPDATPTPIDLVPINGYDRAAEGVTS
jgi:hypothetical protein